MRVFGHYITMMDESSVGGEVKLQHQMASGPKTVFSNHDSAGNLETIFAEQSKRSAENKTIRRNLPGKSHVSRIILHDNTSQERLLDMKLAEIKNSQRKMDAFMTHQKKTFLKRMEKKHTNWAKEHARQAVEFNSKGTRCVGFMLEMMQANPERYGGGRNGTPNEEVGASVAEDQVHKDEEEEPNENNKLPSLDDTGYANAMSQARIPERKLKHRSTGIPSLPTLFSLPVHITQTDDQNPFLTCDQADMDEKLETWLDNEESKGQNGINSVVSFSSDVNINKTLPDMEDVTLPLLGRKTSVVSTRSQTAPKGLMKRLPPVSPGKPRPETEPRNQRTTHNHKKMKNKNQTRLPGPEPTFISEILPRIDTSDPSLVKLQTQHQSKKSRRAKRRARAKETYKRETVRNPLSDERFMRLQSYLSPVPSERLRDSLDMDIEAEETDKECDGSS